MVKSYSELSTPRQLSPSPRPPGSSSSPRRYKGVRMRSWGRWVSEIRIPRSRDKIWLGSYSTPEKAARAFDAAVVLLRGASSGLNFPDSLPEIAVPHCLTSPRTIQATAAAAANANDSLEMLQTEVDDDPRTSSIGEIAELGPAELTCNLLPPETQCSSSLAACEHQTLSDECYTQNFSTGESMNPVLPMNVHPVPDIMQDPHREQDIFEDLFPFGTLSRYGFTPISGAVTVSERFDIDLQPPTDSGLWSL